MPAAVAKLLRRLSQEGAQHIQPPECAHCGQQRPLRRLAPAGRICDPCSAAQKKMKGQCHRCKEERLVSKGPAKASYCRRCINELSTEAPDRIINYVRIHQLIAPPMTRAALGSLPTLRNRLVRLMLEIESYGELWFAEPAHGSRQFCRFYDLLRQAGARLTERQCAGCGTTRTLTERVEGQISCRRCYQQAHQKSCDGCGEHATMERVLSEGRRLCQRCTHQLSDERAVCFSCGNLRLIAFRDIRGPLCSTCRQASKIDTCSNCGIQAPCVFQGTEEALCKACSDAKRIDQCTECRNTRRCRWAGTARAVCEQCSNPRSPCRSCGEVRLRHKRHASGTGYLCWACVPPIIEPCTNCGRKAIVNGRLGGRPFCLRCYPKQHETFRPCAGCGTITRLIAKHCPRCRADQMIRQMVPDDLAASDERIAKLRQRWFQGAPSKIIYAFERGTTAATLITKILADPSLRTHEFIDGAGSESQTRSLRAVLVEHELLPPRDELLARFEAWLAAVLRSIADPQERRYVTQYARWRHLRLLRKNTMPLRMQQISWRRIEIMEVLALLKWTQQLGGSLASLAQKDLDEWLAQGTRLHIHHFVHWTSQQNITAKLSAPSPQRSVLSPYALSQEERWRLLADVTSDGTLEPRTKFAAGMMLLYGIRAPKIVQLRIDDLEISEAAVRVRWGSVPLVLPAEFAPVARELSEQRTAPRLFVDSGQQEWLYPGTTAGHHMAPRNLNGRLRRIGIPPRLARSSALIALIQELPPVVLSRLTGLEISSAIMWSEATGASGSAYAQGASTRFNEGPVVLEE